MANESELKKWSDEQLVDALIQPKHSHIGFMIKEVLRKRMANMEIGTLYKYVTETQAKPNGPAGAPRPAGAPVVGIGLLTDRQLLDEVAATAASNPELPETLPNKMLQECCDTASYQYEGEGLDGERFLSDSARKLYRWCLRELRERAAAL
jgi:hypothetical protein